MWSPAKLQLLLHAASIAAVHKHRQVPQHVQAMLLCALSAVQAASPSLRGNCNCNLLRQLHALLFSSAAPLVDLPCTPLSCRTKGSSHCSMLLERTQQPAELSNVLNLQLQVCHCLLAMTSLPISLSSPASSLGCSLDLLERASEVAQDVVTQPQYGMEQQIHQHCQRALQTAQQGQQSQPR